MGNKLRILQISKFYYPYEGGIEYFVKDLSEELVDVGCDVMVLSHQKSSFVGQQEEVINGVPVIRLPIVATISYAPICLSFPFYLKKIIKEFNPHILHIHMPNLSPLWLSLIKLEVPICIHWHSDVIGLNFWYRFYGPLEKKLLQKAKVVISTSYEYLKGSKVLQEIKNKCEVVPLGINPTRFEYTIPNQNIIKWLGGERFVLSVGRFTYYKGYKYLIKAFSFLKDIKLIIVGQGKEYPNLLKLVQKLGLESRVLLPGYLPDEEKNYLLQKCLAFCLPSYEKTEAFGVSLLEAMHFGKPLITTDIYGSGVNFVNKKNYTGLVVKPKDPYDLAFALQTIANSSPMSSRLGKNSRKRFERLFSIKNVAKKIIRIYNQSIN